MFICTSIPKHNTCSGEANGKVNVVLRHALNYCYRGDIWGINFKSFGYESFLYKKLAQLSCTSFLTVCRQPKAHVLRSVNAATVILLVQNAHVNVQLVRRTSFVKLCCFDWGVKNGTAKCWEQLNGSGRRPKSSVTLVTAWERSEKCCYLCWCSWLRKRAAPSFHWPDATRHCLTADRSGPRRQPAAQFTHTAANRYRPRSLHVRVYINA